MTADQSALDLARRIAQETNHPLPATVQLRQQQPRLSIGEAKALVVQAMNEARGIYYAVASGVPLIEGPFTGLEAAKAGVSNDAFQPVLVCGVPHTDGPHDAVARFLTALPHPEDRSLVYRLMNLLGESKPELSWLAEEGFDRYRLIETVERTLSEHPADSAS